MRADIRMHGGEFIAAGDIIADAVGGKWDNPSGAFNVALKENLTKISVADDWSEARKEWRATGNLWYVPMKDDAVEVLPEPHKSSHPHYCICGHPIAWHFEIENTENGRTEIVGSEHIGFWMIVRHMVENLNIPEDMVTQERVKEWIAEAVKSMKAEWWWSQYGEEFEEWFTAIRELDAVLNTRQGKNYWDRDTERMEYQLLIRKKAEGKMGTPDYQMASIVWRWNHPDNPKAQIHTRGYPNERLWNDLQIFYFSLARHQETFNQKNEERANRINEVAEEKRIRAEEEVRRQQEWEARRAEDRRRRQEELDEQNRLRETAVERTCEEWGIPELTSETGRNDWEKSFLGEMIKKIKDNSYISPKQKNRIIKIANRLDDEATEKQLAYIRKLGGTPNPNLTKQQASQMIDELLNKEE